ncbi:MAG: hypothetical protein JO314_11525 [Acidobacteria bacterium]|nr:hypothetical protein [Acidobacteriota bacterium]
MKTGLPHHNGRRDPKLIVGLFALAVANSLHYLLPRFFAVSTDGFDFVYGAMMGIAIGLLIWFVATNGRRRDLRD